MATVDNRHWPKVALVVLLAIAAVWLVSSGTYRELQPEMLRQRLLAWGAWGPAAYLVMFTTLQPLGPSGHLFVLGAALVWPPWTAFGLALAGAVAGQLAGFLFYRYAAHDWAQARIPERLRRYERAIVERPFRSVLLFRLATFTWPLAPAILGASSVRLPPMLLATVVGLAPGVALDVWLGAGLLSWLLS